MARPTLWPIVKLSLRPKSPISTHSSWRTAKPEHFYIKIEIGKNDVVSQLINSPHHSFHTPRPAQRDSLGPGP